MNYGTIVSGDEEYEVVVPLETEYMYNTVTFTSPDQMKVVILCEHCRNFRLDPIELHSLEELVEAGWVVKKEKTNERPA